MRQKRTKQLRRKSQKKNNEFTTKTRVYDLIKKEFHNELKCLSGDINPYVKDASTIDWKHLRYFEYDEDKSRKEEFILRIARFLLKIGKGNGLKCRMSVFIRYLASNEHSNFGLKYRSLNTLIYRLFDYLESQEKES